MLASIPIYKILLEPYSYLLIHNKNLTALDLLKQLPNHKNVSHEKNILGKDVKQIRRYYENQLLIESKRYCRTLLEELNSLTEEYNRTLLANNLESIFEIIAIYRLPYFKILILEDLKACNLFRGRLKQEIEKSGSVEAIIKILRKYTVQSKLTRCIKVMH